MLHTRLVPHKNTVHCVQAERLMKQLADYYLDQFNQVKATGIYPTDYLSKADALRELQYLCEYFKIRQFELAGNPSLTW